MKKRWKVAIVLLSVLVVGVVAFFIYLSDYRTLDEEYYKIFDEVDVHTHESWVHFEADSEEGIVFYPGGKVEYLAYAPFCQKLQDEGINVFLVDVPFNFAIFSINKADELIENYEDISKWYVGGHSLGGVTASMYAAENKTKIDGLILTGVYLAMDYDLEDTLTINGSNDLRVGDAVNYVTNAYVIEGGNHAQFGNYGPNDGDGVATITADEQQNEAVKIIVDFLKERS